VDPFEFRRRIKPDTIIAFLVGVGAAWVLQIRFRFGTSAILTALIVIGVGGLWYKWRKVV